MMRCRPFDTSADQLSASGWSGSRDGIAPVAPGRNSLAPGPRSSYCGGRGFEQGRSGVELPESPNTAYRHRETAQIFPIVLATVKDAVAYACHQAAETIFRSMSEQDVTRPVESPMGTYPAWQYFLFAYDEHCHHRGQLYVYRRLLGKRAAQPVRLRVVVSNKIVHCAALGKRTQGG